MRKRALSSLLLWTGCFFFFGCISDPPNLDYTYARSALAAARQADAPQHAPGYWNKAEEAYKRAVKLYDDRQPDRAKRLFRQARKYGERAENIARLKRAKGEIF